VLVLPAGATILQALEASGIRSEEPVLAPGLPDLGIWGRKAAPGQVLCDGDRVEIYRPLRVDPKVARRERFRSQGVRSAGLFAKKNRVADSGR
jgi:putative ubiquitin-RnfH superfamily antitoxin RatB of RatAB toxin-antitoxin module